MSNKLRFIPVAAASALSLIVAAAVAPSATAATAASDCSAMTSDVYQAVNPKTQANLLTVNAKEIVSAGQKYGFTDDRGNQFDASTTASTGLSPVYRLWNPKSGDFVWIINPTERDNAVSKYGYQLQGVNFYASTKQLDCSVPVHRFLKGAKHRFAVTQADRDALSANGWRDEGARFWAAPAQVTKPPVEPTDTTFTLAVIPDTQQDVFGSDRLTNRAQWLVQQRDALDLEFVMHTGDVVNWDTPDHAQYVNASESLKILDDAGVPTALAIGNHDTYAVGEGGSARPGGNAKIDVRNTETFNRYFSVDRYQVEGTFESGKIDNNYQLFSAGGEDWMIVTLELWARPEAIEWAKKVVAQYSDRNVIVVTHSYLDAEGNISQSNGGYGATSPQYLYDNLISVYPNVRMVFSGHVGAGASRVDTGVNGNKVVSFLGAFHSSTTNQLRLVEIDTAADTINTRVYSPNNDQTFTQYTQAFDGMKFD